MFVFFCTLFLFLLFFSFLFPLFPPFPSSLLKYLLYPTARRLEDQFSSMLSLGGEDDDVEDDLALALDPSAPTFDPLDFNEDLRFARGEFRAATTEISQNLLALQSFLRETDAPHGVDGTDEAVGGEEAENNTEANVEHFESALTGLRRLRESAQQLPDAQRKALAAQVISMLFPDEEDWQ